MLLLVLMLISGSWSLVVFFWWWFREVVFSGVFCVFFLVVVFGGVGVSCSCRESGCGGVRARGSPVAAALVGASGSSSSGRHWWEAGRNCHQPPSHNTAATEKTTQFNHFQIPAIWLVSLFTILGSLLKWLLLRTQSFTRVTLTPSNYQTFLFHCDHRK